MRKVILFAACLLPLSACSKTPVGRADIPANVAQPCDPIPPFTGKTSDDLVTQYLRLTALYKDCSARHSGL